MAAHRAVTRCATTLTFEYAGGADREVRPYPVPPFHHPPMLTDSFVRARGLGRDSAN